MKMEMGNGRLRIVGKAWQVRACLRQLASHSLTLKRAIDSSGAKPGAEIPPQTPGGFRRAGTVVKKRGSSFKVRPMVRNRREGGHPFATCSGERRKGIQ